MQLGRKFLYSLFTVASVALIAFAILGFCGLVATSDDAVRDPQIRAEWDSASNAEVVLVGLAVVGGAWLKARPRDESSDSTEAL